MEEEINFPKFDRETQTNRLLTDEMKWAIVIASKYFDLSYSEISERFDVSKGTISKIIQKYEKQQNVQNNYQNSGGSNSIIDNDFIEQLKLSIINSKDIKYSVTNVTQQYNEEQNSSVSRTTIYRGMKLLSMIYGRIYLLKSLTPQQKDTRVRYCKQMVKKRLNPYVYTDESLFCLTDNKLNIWSFEDNDMIIPYKEPQYKDRQVMVWGGISLIGRTSLYFHSGTIDSQCYQECVTESFIPFKKKVFGKRKCYLVQDGARSHTSKITLEWFQQKNIDVIQNPALSLDLNPIELVWSLMKHEFKKQQLNTKINKREELIEKINEIWKNLSDEFISNCIHHMKEVFNEVIENDGERYKSK